MSTFAPPHRRFAPEEKRDAVISFLDTYHPSVLEEIEDFLFVQMMKEADTQNTISGADFLKKYGS